MFDQEVYHEVVDRSLMQLGVQFRWCVSQVVHRNVQVFVPDSLPVFVHRAERVGDEHELRQASAQVFAASFGLVNAHELETQMLKVVVISGRIISGRNSGRHMFANDVCRWCRELDRSVHVCAGLVFDLSVSAVAVPHGHLLVLVVIVKTEMKGAIAVVR